MIKQEIRDWRDNSVIFIAEINCAEDAPHGIKLGLSVVEAVRQGKSLAGSDLRGSNLAWSDLARSNLIAANLAWSNLRGANLRGSNLAVSNLRGSDLRGSDLRGSNLAWSNLKESNLAGSNIEGSNIEGANLEPIKRDMFSILKTSIEEIPYLRKALVDGKVDGSTYEGECACLCGTIENGGYRARNGGNMPHDKSRPIECFFLAIHEGDTPENSQFSALAVKWIDEFVSSLGGNGSPNQRSV